MVAGVLGWMNCRLYAKMLYYGPLIYIVRRYHLPLFTNTNLSAWGDGKNCNVCARMTTSEMLKFEQLNVHFKLFSLLGS
jgi:hypothetical protein